MQQEEVDMHQGSCVGVEPGNMKVLMIAVTGTCMRRSL